MRLRIARFVLIAVTALLPVTSRAEELTRIDQIREQITATKTLLDQATRNNEKVNLQARLDRLNRELENQETRLRLQAKEQELEKALSATPLSALRETLRRIDVSADHLKEEITRTENEMRQLETQRDQLVEQRVATRTDNDKGAALASEIEERVINARESIRALSVERDALTQELQLAQEVDRIQARLKSTEKPSVTTLSEVTEAKEQLRQRDQRMATESEQLTNLQDLKNATNASLELTRQKLAQIDEDIVLLEKQTGIFNSNTAIVRLLNAARSQKKFLDQRLTAFSRQVAALDRNISAINRTTELLTREAVWLRINYAELKNRYLSRFTAPGFIVLGLIILYVVVSRLVIPFVRPREDVLLSRRLARYIFLLVGFALVGAFFFEDLKTFLTALTIVSAAIVIALQDVCASLAGWFVIIAGAKFRIGDRIEVDGDRGDVLDIELLRTTILEVGRTASTDKGNGLSADHPTGRIIILPNSFVLKTKVFNATHGHPFVWNRQVFTFTNETPFREVEAIVHRVVEEETAEDFAEARRAAAQMEKRYGVSDADYRPKIYVRLADWGVEFSCLHVCHFRKVNESQSRIHRRMEEELLRDPRLVTAYPTQRQITGYESITMPELAQQHSGGPAVSAVTSMPSGSMANVTVTDQRSGNGQHNSASASAESASTPAPQRAVKNPSRL